MFLQYSCVYRKKRHLRTKGFTLIELIVAIAVVSVAATVFMSLYTSSLTLARAAQNKTVAATLAEEQMNAILQHPDHFYWAIPEEENAAQFPIGNSTEDPKVGNPVEAPTILPAEEWAKRQSERLYKQFRWQAYGRLPDPQASYYEVTVVIRWTEGGRAEALALTGSCPRFQVDASQASLTTGTSA